MDKVLTVLIVGGYGTFGGRLAELLEGEPGLALIIAGRSQAKAESWCRARREARARLIPAAFDRNNAAPALAALKPDIVVDASGPFQAYGDYALVRACIAAGVHYLDLADAADFVTGITTLDDDARRAGVFVISGVSSFPVLTWAVVRELSQGMAKVTAITGGIAPSPYANVGINVLRAIASYAGQKITRRKNGGDNPSWPLTETRRYTIAPPGGLPLRNLLFSLVDVPDLRVLAGAWPAAQDVWMGAGPVPEPLHRALICLSWLVRWRLLRSLVFLAPVMDAVMKRVAWGEDRGGMFIEVTGESADGKTLRRSWHLTAEGRHGPLIPSMAAEAVIRMTQQGKPPEAGARTGAGLLTLNDYAALFKGCAIKTGKRDDSTPAPVLYRQILGDAYDALPPALQAMHDVTDTAQATGVATVRRGRNPLARLACALFRLPPAGENVPLTVTFTVQDGRERWRRQFGASSFETVLSAGHGKSERLVVERFGPVSFALVSFAMALTVENGRLNMVVRRWHLLGIPMPLWLGARTETSEFADAEGRFNFDVKIFHPLMGMMAHYTGWLVRRSS